MTKTPSKKKIPMEIKQAPSLRQDYGDLDKLIHSIQKIGRLIHPITVSKDGIVVTGNRRYQAWRKLHKANPDRFRPFPPFIRLDKTYAELTQGRNLYLHYQMDENMIRKDFTMEEIADMKAQLEELRKSGNLPDAKGRDTRDLVAEMAGISGKQVDKITTLVERARDNKQAAKLLEQVNSKRKSVDTAHKIITQKERNLPKVELPEGIFDVIMEDPPLSFDRGATARGASENHYPTMSLQEICDLAVPSADNAVFFEWIPTSMKYDTQTVMIRGEEFTGSTIECIMQSRGIHGVNEFIMPKPRLGMGAYNFSSHETCIMCFKGKMPTPAKRFPSVLPPFKGKHSEKPDEFYSWVRQMYPKRRYLAMFELKPRDGWTVFGNMLPVNAVSTGADIDAPTIVDDSPIARLRNLKKR